jgi:hypothetical protein
MIISPQSSASSIVFVLVEDYTMQINGHLHFLTERWATLLLDEETELTLKIG